MKSWMPSFEQDHAPNLDFPVDWQAQGLASNLYQRQHGFRMILSALEAQDRAQYNIVETGVMRDPDNGLNDNSTLIWQNFVTYHGGRVCSVDINAETCDRARQFAAPCTEIFCSDSVAFLNSRDWSDFDLFYLDSWDVKWRRPEASAQHHLREFQAIERYLVPGKVLAIDDNTWLADTGSRTGKGMLIYEYLAKQGRHPDYDGYQLIYLW